MNSVSIKNGNEDVKNLAYRSSGFIIIMSIGFLLCLSFAIILTLYENKSGSIKSGPIAFFILALICLIILIPLIASPKYPICYSDSCLILNTYKKKDIFVKYEDIIEVIYKKARSRMMTYSFGKIIIVIKSERIVLKNVKQVKKVKEKIIELKTLKKRPDNC